MVSFSASSTSNTKSFSFNILTQIFSFNLVSHTFVKSVQNVSESQFLHAAILPSCILTHSCSKWNNVIMFNQTVLEIQIEYYFIIESPFGKMIIFYILLTIILPFRYQRMQRTCTWIWCVEIHSSVLLCRRSTSCYLNPLVNWNKKKGYNYQRCLIILCY